IVCSAAAPATTATKPPSGMPSSHLLFGRAQRRAHQPFLESVIFLTLCSELGFDQPAVCRIFICRTGGHDSDQKSVPICTQTREKADPLFHYPITPPPARGAHAPPRFWVESYFRAPRTGRE